MQPKTMRWANRAKNSGQEKRKKGTSTRLSSDSLVTLFIIALTLMTGCKQSDSGANPVAIERTCVANSVDALRLLPNLPACSVEDSTCQDACLAGDAASCLSRAYAVQKNSSARTEAVLLYHRGCLLGSANACTNYAASIWARPHSREQLACARKTFEKACQAKEPFACGMVGRVILEDAKTPDQFKEGRRYLEKACNEFNGFPCRVLAKHLESGKLGDYEPILIRDLLQRACAGGDPDGCGEPKTASETFR